MIVSLAHAFDESLCTYNPVFYRDEKVVFDSLMEVGYVGIEEGNLGIDDLRVMTRCITYVS